jgi:hypothetical protein
VNSEDHIKIADAVGAVLSARHRSERESESADEEKCLTDRGASRWQEDDDCVATWSTSRLDRDAAARLAFLQ